MAAPGRPSDSRAPPILPVSDRVSAIIPRDFLNSCHFQAGFFFKKMINKYRGGDIITFLSNSGVDVCVGGCGHCHFEDVQPCPIAS
ncbi:Protein of unknown function [Cotesia congregata]|uniref:Uncharacterized protein n=1 Tax=Cotesia congregata TaxID=51543 RepID=A0A8J2H5K3_COTCN|nr:Protein of unknown function [Cotesia congregata]